jgi:hypothetical protein
MANNDEKLQQLQGQLDAVTLLCSTLAAVTSPAVAHLVLARADRAAQVSTHSATQAAYAAGYAAAALPIRSALEIAAAAQKTPDSSDPATH